MRGERVIVIDVGNTSTSLGLFQGLKRLNRIDVPTHETTEEDAARTLRSLVGAEHVQGAVLGSVVPKVNPIWTQAVRSLRKTANILNVSCKLDIGLPINYPKPETIGADRLANACAAAHCFGAPVIVADFGTAVTFDVVEARRGYVGGIIAPGLMLMFSYLAERTALLPSIRPAPVRGWVGRSTEQAMRLGAKWGYRGLVKEIVRELTRHPSMRKAKICATGGWARWCLRGSGLRITVDPDLTLYGLARIYQLNARDTE